MKNCSRLILVIIVALIGTLFFGQMTAFCMEATELQETCFAKLSVLEELGVKVSIYDKEELTDEQIEMIPDSNSEVEDMEVSFVFFKKWYKDNNFEVFVGSKLNAKVFKKVKVASCDSHEDWKNSVVIAYSDAIINDIVANYTFEEEEVSEEPIKKEPLGKRVVFGALEFIWNHWKVCGTVLIAIWAVNQILELLEKVKKFFTRIFSIFPKRKRKRA